jgi:hypothetical protein
MVEEPPSRLRRRPAFAEPALCVHNRRVAIAGSRRIWGMGVMRSLSPKSGARRAAVLLALLFCASAVSAAQRVPFVGCRSDGQLGPVAAPKGSPKAVNVDAALASQLAYYQAKDAVGVLAPRGWACFYFYGSSGSALIVAPSGKLDDPELRLAGPAVTLTVDFGGTSGRFEVAKYSARLFAKEEQAFIAGVIAEGIEPKENFVFQPYPQDKTTYKSARLAEYETPAGAEGLGTSGRLQTSADATVGMAQLKGGADEPDLILLAVRLPPAQAKLAPAIVGAAE